jgi:hypothetical protein
MTLRILPMGHSPLERYGDNLVARSGVAEGSGGASNVEQ